MRRSLILAGTAIAMLVASIAGAFISDEFLQWFGLASFLIPALLVIVALRAFAATGKSGFSGKRRVARSFTGC